MVREIISLQHPLVKHFVKLRQNHDYRDEHQSVLIEGSRLVNEVCKNHHTKTLMACDSCLIPSNIKADDVYIVNEQIMKKITGTLTPEGIVAEVFMPKMSSLKGLKYILACDEISDPGNLGTLLRSALALGWDGAFILKNSCDPYNDKALRAAKGATFRIPIAMGSWEDLQKIINENHLKPFVADLHGIDLRNVVSKDGILLVMSNEARGASEEAKKACQAITIPMPGEMESLNVAAAGAILMYNLKG